jgi:ABC-type branched-subunit amino acid transport system ATPase component/ABC-type branched-subunit amino acid transport system permease subunit
MFALSAYVTGALMTGQGWSFWLAGPAAICAAVAGGLILSLVGLRVSRFYFAMVGFFLVTLTPEIVQVFKAQTGGSSGLVITEVPTFFGTPLDTSHLLILSAVVLVLALFFVRNLRSSPMGVHMRRMRDDPFVLSMAGTPAWRVRAATYVVSCAFAGFGGAIYSQLNGFLAPYDFDVTFTILLFAAVLVGGSTSLLGPAIGIFLLYVIPRMVIDVQGYSDLVYGGTILIAVLLLPDGVDQAVRDLSGHLRRRADPKQQAAHTLQDQLSTSPEDLGHLLWRFRDGERQEDASLVVRRARKSFDGVRALDFDDGQEVTVEPGQVHLLLGPNGSGKTSLLNAMCGLARLDGGTVYIGSQDVTGATVSHIARMGVSRSYQSPRLPDELVPREMLAGVIADMRSVRYIHWLTNDWIAGRARREALRTADEILAAAGLADASERRNQWLTSGQRRTMDVLMALTSTSVIVLLDEPAAGLSSQERESLGATVRALARHGIGFLIVEHDVDLGLSIADRVTVMAGGAIVAQDKPEKIREHAYVRDVLMGPAANEPA